MKVRIGILALCAVGALAPSATQARDRSQITLAAGVFDMVWRHKQEVIFGAEYRFADGFFASEFGAFRGFKPILGVQANTSSAAYAYAGLAAPFEFDNGRWEITPAGGVGAYHSGNSLDLGGTFAFRASLGVSYRITRGARIGVMLDHLSNAHIYARNPGVNSAMLTWSWLIEN